MKPRKLDGEVTGRQMAEGATEARRCVCGHLRILHNYSEPGPPCTLCDCLAYEKERQL